LECYECLELEEEKRGVQEARALGPDLLYTKVRLGPGLGRANMEEDCHDTLPGGVRP
jgi:hypothetical protein